MIQIQMQMKIFRSILKKDKVWNVNQKLKWASIKDELLKVLTGEASVSFMQPLLLLFKVKKDFILIDLFILTGEVQGGY